jgi:hypothetical protein
VVRIVSLWPEWDDRERAVAWPTLLVERGTTREPITPIWVEALLRGGEGGRERPLAPLTKHAFHLIYVLQILRVNSYLLCLEPRIEL